MKQYYFTAFDGDRGVEEFFGQSKKAIEYANYFWDHLTDKEKEGYLWCYVTEIEASKEEIEDLKGGYLSISGYEKSRELWDKGKTTTEIERLRFKAGLSRAEMSRQFEIPIRTLENWEAGVNHPPVWAEKLILEKLNHMIEGKE